MYNRKSQKNKHLTYLDRLFFERLYNIEHYSIKSLAKEFNCHISSVYREIKRGIYKHLNTDLTYIYKYSADIAQNDYNYKATSKGADLKINKQYYILNQLEFYILNYKYSPYSALEAFKKKYGFKPFSLSTFYNYIDKGIFLNISNKNLPERSKHKRKYSKTHNLKRLSNGKSIDKRPEYINNRKTFGHWEIDTVVGKRSGSRQILLVLTERLSRFEIILKLKDKTCKSVVNALNKIQSKLSFSFNSLFKSITCDNGCEFQDDYSIEFDKTGNKRTTLYYCHPYSSYERGSNERQNRIIRRFLPKGKSLYSVSNKDCSCISDWINNLPRKLFSGLSSREIFENYCNVFIDK